MRHVLCFGNLLHGDDGAGPALAQRLLAGGLPAGVRVFDVGTRGLDALALLEGVTAVLLVDAEAPAGEPGRVALRDARALTGPGGDASGVSAAGHGPHLAGPLQLLRAAAALGCQPPAQLLSVQAAALRPFHAQLSPPVRQALPALEARARHWMARACATPPTEPDR